MHGRHHLSIPVCQLPLVLFWLLSCSFISLLTPATALAAVLASTSLASSCRRRLETVLCCHTVTNTSTQAISISSFRLQLELSKSKHFLGWRSLIMFMKFTSIPFCTNNLHFAIILANAMITEILNRVCGKSW